jgi:two-component system sensor histidine kinase/response regulator
LQTIHDSGERLLELINDILDMSHIEAGRAMLNMREFSLSGLASQSLEAVRERALNNGVSLNLDLNLSTGQDTLVADPQRVRQILMNLLSNAVKFTPTGGTVTLKVRAESNAAIFQVEDTGIGISEEQRPLLFQKFQQLDPSRRRSYGGTGLGLALTKQLVELHGGWLGVESKVGVGSVFTVRIPSQRVSLSASAREGQSTEGVLPSRRVVLFEEDEESANIVCDMLTAAGHQVIWMMDGSTVPEQVKLMDPALVILGMDLSGADSCDLIRTLRHSPATQLIKILTLVADVSNGLGQHSLEAGADDYVAKPIRPDQLLNRINALIYTAPNS